MQVAIGVEKIKVFRRCFDASLLFFHSWEPVVHALEMTRAGWTTQKLPSVESTTVVHDKHILGISTNIEPGRQLHFFLCPTLRARDGPSAGPTIPGASCSDCPMVRVSWEKRWRPEMPGRPRACSGASCEMDRFHDDGHLAATRCF